MASYVKSFFRAKRRKTDSTSEEGIDVVAQLPPRPTSSSGATSGASSSGSSAFLSPTSTQNSRDFQMASSATSPIASRPMRQGIAGRLRMRASGWSGAETSDGTGLLGHRRQHSSPGHLEQHQEEQQSRRAAIIARVYNKRKAIEQPYDESARPPKFAERSAFIKSNVTLTGDDVRMIIFSPEKVVFDSKGVVLYTPGDELLPGARLSPCEGFQLTKKSKDANRMNSMIFAAVPSAKNSDTFRIHVLEDCELFVISKTFCFPRKEEPAARRGNASKRPATSSRDHDLAPPPPPSISRLLESSDPESQNTIKSLDGWRPRTSNSIMSTPEGFSRVRHVSLNIGHDGEEEVVVGGGSPGSSNSLPRAFSPPHRLSSYRRRQMAVTTSLSETSAVAVPSNPKSRSRMSSMSSTIADDDTRPFSTRQMRHVALGIIVPFAQRPFMLQHIPLIEAEMTRLEERIVAAYADTKTFLRSLHTLHTELSTIVCELHNAPRLELPYWLALNEKCALDEKTLAVEFCEHLSYLVRRYDRKEAGYFLSNLFSALLMHHLSWVASVAAPPLAASLDPRMRNSLFGPTEDGGTPTVGYNALMAQYLEISGACGNVRSAKICILGDDAEIMASMISVISFFIRCSAVKHVAPDTNQRIWDLPTEQPFSPIEVSGSPGSAASSRAGCSHLHPTPRQRNGASTSSNPGPSTPSSSSSMPLFSMPGPSTSSQPSFFQPPMPQPSTSTIPQPSVILDRLEEGASSSKAMMTRLRENAQKKKLEAAAAAAGASGPPSTSSTRDSDAPVPSTSTPAPSRPADSTPRDFPIVSETADMWTSRPNHEKSLGRSMFAGPLDNFCTHFVLSAVKKSEANMTEVYSRMFDEVRCNDNAPAHRSSTTSTAIHHQSVSSQSTSSMGDPVIPENFLIVADIDARTVKVLSSEGSDEVTSPSESVVGLLEQFVGIHEGMTSTAEFLVGMLEDNLAQIVGTSSTLVELVRGLDQARAPVRPAAAAPAPSAAKPPSTPSTSSTTPVVHPPTVTSPSQQQHLSPDRVRSIIGCDHSDLRLMINVAGVYWPPVVQSVLG